MGASLTLIGPTGNSYQQGAAYLYQQDGHWNLAVCKETL